MSLPTKAELLKQTESLSYQQRAKLVAELAAKHANDPKLKELIASLREHPAPEVSETQTDYKMKALFPKQQKSVSKFYNEDQLAITAAVVSKNAEVLKDEFHSPSFFFKYFVTNQMVALEASDDAIYDEFVKAAPKVKRFLLRAAIKQQRLTFLAKAVKFLQDDPEGPNLVPQILHGCSSPVVAEYLPKYSNHANLQWNYLCRYHGKVVTDFMHKQLLESTPLGREAVWADWASTINRSDRGGKALPRPRGTTELVEQGQNGNAVLNMFKTLPPLRYIGSGTVADDQSTFNSLPLYKVMKVVPAIVETELEYYIKHNPDELVEIVTNGLAINNYDYMVSHPEISHWASKSWEWKHKKAILVKLTSLSTPHSFFYSSSYEARFCRSIGAFMTHLSLAELDELLPILRDYYVKYQSNKDEWRSRVIELLYAVSPHFANIANTVQRKKASQPALVQQFKARAQTGFIAWLNTFVPLLTARWRNADVLDSEATEVVNLVERLHLPQFPEACWKLWELTAKFRAGADSKTRYPLKWESNYLRLARHTTIHLKSFTEDSINASDAIKSAADHLTSVTNDRIAYAAKYPVELVHLFKEIILAFNDTHPALPALRLKAYKAISSDTIIHLARHEISFLWDIFDAVPLEEIQAAIASILADTGVSIAIKDRALPYQDISEPKIRTALQKMTNSSNETERKNAFTYLFSASVRAQKKKGGIHVLRTLTFIRGKIKNEALATRLMVLSLLSTQVNTNEAAFFPTDVPQADLFQVYNDLVQDTLEAPDLDSLGSSTILTSHPVLNHCLIVGYVACRAALQSKEKTRWDLFEFGVELQWKMTDFKMGRKEASQTFQINFGIGSNPATYIYTTFPETYETAVVKIIDAYRTRVEEKNPKWAEPYPVVVRNLFVGVDWWKSQTLVGWVKQAIAELKSGQGRVGHHPAATSDSRGRGRGRGGSSPAVTSGDNTFPSESTPVYTFLNDIRAAFWARTVRGAQKAPEEAEATALTNEFSDLLLRSRLAPVFFKEWWCHVTKTLTQTPQQRYQAEVDAAIKLLSITKSAIYLRPIQRVLIRRRQDLLSEYIGQQQTFRGPFYIEPAERQLYKKAAAGSAGGDDKPKKAKKVRLTALATRDADNDNEKETEVQDEVFFGDHRDMFLLETCFDLHKLLPSQVQTIADQWKRAIFNPDRPIAERTVAAQRWTLMPTIGYADIAEFIEAYEPKPKEKKKDDASEPKPEAVADPMGTEATWPAEGPAKTPGKKAPEHPTEVSVNVIEALLRGVMHNDEPTAPLSYLLSPKFLGSDRARVAIYAISRCVPFMQTGGLTKIIRMLLTGKNRHFLKITSYKEILRLLIRDPTEEHLKIIRHEWDRDEVHRDIRVTIIQLAFITLGTRQERTEDLAWYIIDSASGQTDPEICCALLKISSSTVGQFSPPGNIFRLPRLAEYFKAMTDQKIFPEHVARYFKVLLKLLKHPSDDIRILALLRIVDWREGNLDNDAATKLLHDYLVDETSPFFSSQSPDEIEVFHARWQLIMDCLGKYCNIFTSTGAGAKPSTFFAVWTWLCQFTIKQTDRQIRNRFFLDIDYVISRLPSTPHYSEQTELDVLKPLKEIMQGMFWKQTSEREARLAHHWNKFELNSKKVIDEAINTAVAHPYLAAAANANILIVIQYTGTASGFIRSTLLPTLLRREMFDADFNAAKTTAHIQFIDQVAFKALETVSLYSTLFNGTQEFLLSTLRLTAEGKLPFDKTKHTQVSSLIIRTLDSINYSASRKLRTLSHESVQLLKAFIDPAFKKPEDRSRYGVLNRLVAISLANANPELVVLAYNTKADLLNVLLFVLKYYMYEEDDPSKSQKIITGLFERFGFFQGIGELIALYDMLLENPTKDQNLANAVLTTMIQVFKSDTSYATKKKPSFLRFINWAIASAIQHPLGNNVRSDLYDIIRSALDATIKPPKRNISQVVEYITTLVERKFFEIPHDVGNQFYPLQPIKASYNSFLDHLICDLVIHFGMQEQVEFETQKGFNTWQAPFLAILDKYTVHPDPSLRTRAIRQTTIHPKSAASSSSSVSSGWNTTTDSW